VQDLKIFKHELQLIINGKSISSQNSVIQAAKAHLTNYSKTSNQTKAAKPDRAEEEKALTEFTTKNNFWLKDQNLGIYITEGAEQKIFYKNNSDFIYKKADAIFYTSWIDYFDNLLLHNHFFPDTSYTLVGFCNTDNKLFAIVQQPFVLSTEPTNLKSIKTYLLSNGFINKKNNDFYHPYLGVILEDLHDENVLTNNGVLFFIDTVFYITATLYQQE
jgi:hypothetical protein